MADGSYSGGPKGGGRVALDSEKIFVGGLSWQTTEESLRYHFEQYGPVVSVEVMRDRVTGDPRGFAFVIFSKEETVDLVMKDEKHVINHKVVDVKRAQARGVAPPSIHQSRQSFSQGGSTTAPATVKQEGGNMMSPEQLQNKVFVGGLPPSVDRDALRACFEQFGSVVDSIVMMDQAMQRSRGFGFITFENGTGGAQKAIAAQPVEIHGRHAEVKLATPKGEQTPRSSGGGGGGFHGGGGGGASSAGGFHGQKPFALGLRAGVSGSSTGEFAGLAASYGRNGWKAGYGSKAFGKAGWAVHGWDDGGSAPERSGFSFDMISEEQPPPAKRARRPN